MNDYPDPHNRYDKELKELGDQLVVVRSQMTEDEQAIVSKRVDDLGLGYMYLSSDEAHIQRGTAWLQEGQEYLSRRDAGTRYHNARAQLASEEVTEVDREYTRQYGNAADHDTLSYAWGWAKIAEEFIENRTSALSNLIENPHVTTTSGGFGESYPQDVREAVENAHGDDYFDFLAEPEPVENMLQQYRYRVLVTGSADWQLSAAVQEGMMQTWLSLDRSPILWVTRGTPTGADKMAEFVAGKQQMPWEQFAPRPEDGTRGPRIANRELLMAGVDAALVFVRNRADDDLAHIQRILRMGGVPTQTFTQTDPGVELERVGAHRADT